MAGSGGDDRTLRRLRYAAAAVLIGAVALLLGAYIVGFATREQAPAPDGPLVIVIVTSLLILLGLKAPDFNLSGLVRPSAPDDKSKKPDADG